MTWLQGREKIGLVLTFTDMGFDVVVSDVDTVWLKDPIPYLAKYPEADILVSSDSLVCIFVVLFFVAAVTSKGGLQNAAMHVLLGMSQHAAHCNDQEVDMNSFTS